MFVEVTFVAIDDIKGMYEYMVQSISAKFFKIFFAETATQRFFKNNCSGNYGRFLGHKVRVLTRQF